MVGLLEKKQPKPGTKLRGIYDLFQENKGLPLHFPTSGSSGLYQLTDFYGLDIIRLKKNTWLLAGEWYGKVYVDYVAERILKENKNNS